MSKKVIPYNSAREVVQSLIVTTGRRNWNISAERILMKLVQVAQSDFQDKRIDNYLCIGPSFNYPGVNRVDERMFELTIPISELVPENDRHYERVREGILQLQKTVLEWMDYKRDDDGNLLYTKSGKRIQTWNSVQVLGKSKADIDWSGDVTLRIDGEIWREILNVSRGIRAYDLTIANSISSHYALRLYQLMSRQKKKYKVTFEEFRKMFGIPDSYKPFHIEDRILLPAQKELDKHSPYSFKYEFIKDNETGKAGRKAYKFIEFCPVYIPVNENQKGPIYYEEGRLLDPLVQDYLLKKYGFAWPQMERLNSLFMKAESTMESGDPDFLGFLKAMSVAAEYAEKPRRYLVGAIIKHLQEKYGVYIDKESVQDYFSNAF